jgi:pimeloyl-ACP methyl ester carboxylesterase
MVATPMNELTPFDVQLRGRRVRYVDGGARTLPAVVLLHGIGRDHAQWLPLASSLARHRRVVALDLPGFGMSEPLRSAMRWEELADTVLDLVALLELGRVTLIGHSMGAAISIAAAADRPEFVERLVLIAPSCYRATRSFEDRLMATPILGPTLFRRVVGPTVLRRHVGFDARPSPHAWTMIDATTSPTTIEARVPRVRAPSLVIWGRDDRIVPWTHGTRLARELGAARLEILDCAHFPEEELPTVVDALIREFLGITTRGVRGPGATRGAVG